MKTIVINKAVTRYILDNKNIAYKVMGSKPIFLIFSNEVEFIKRAFKLAGYKNIQ